MDDQDQVIAALREQLQRLSAQSNRNDVIYPPASAAELDATEEVVGFEFPLLLRRIYSEVGNGGALLGPGYGLFGIEGGHGSDDRMAMVPHTLEIQQHFNWFDQMLVVCDWGCGMLSCIDCSDGDFPVFRWDWNECEEEDKRSPSDKLWDIEEDCLEDWLLKPNHSALVFGK